MYFENVFWKFEVNPNKTIKMKTVVSLCQSVFFEMAYLKPVIKINQKLLNQFCFKIFQASSEHINRVLNGRFLFLNKCFILWLKNNHFFFQEKSIFWLWGLAVVCLSNCFQIFQFKTKWIYILTQSSRIFHFRWSSPKQEWSTLIISCLF